MVLYVRGPQPQPYPGHEGALHLLGDRGHQAAQEGRQLHAETLLALLLSTGYHWIGIYYLEYLVSSSTA